jgi:hypothetical protein
MDERAFAATGNAAAAVAAVAAELVTAQGS